MSTDQEMNMKLEAIVPKKAPEKTKAELFAEDPDRFEDLEEVLFCVKRDAEGKAMVLNRCKSSIDNDMVLARTIMACTERDLVLKMMKAQTSPVVAPKPGGFLNGVRNIGRR